MIIAIDTETLQSLWICSRHGLLVNYMLLLRTEGQGRAENCFFLPGAVNFLTAAPGKFLTAQPMFAFYLGDKEIMIDYGEHVH